MPEFPLFLLTVVLMAAASWHLMIFINVVSQVLTGILLTRKSIIGQLARGGKGNKCFMFRWKLFEFWLPVNVLNWRLGFCSFGNNYVTAPKKIFIAIMGTFSAILAGIALYWLSLTFDWPYMWKQFFFVFISTNLVHILMYANKRQNRLQFSLANNLIFCMDLTLIPTLREMRPFEKKLLPALALFDKKQYQESAAMIETLIKRADASPAAYKTGILAYWHTRDFSRALAMHEAFTVAYSLTPLDRAQAADIKRELGMFEESKKDYDEAISLNPDEPMFLNNRGYLLAEMELYPAALSDLDKAIDLSPSWAYPYCNRGFVKMKIGLLAQGLADVEKSIEMDPENPWGWRNLGIYHQYIGENEKALAQYHKAKDMNPHLHHIDRLINDLS